MFGLTLKRKLQPIPGMEKITTAQGMFRALQKLIEQDKQDRQGGEDDVEFAIAISNKYLAGVNFSTNYELIDTLHDQGCVVTWFKCHRYKLFVPLEYWHQVRDYSVYHKKCKNTRRAVIRSIKRESYITFVD